MTLTLNGIGVAKGIGIGRARLLQHGSMDIVQYSLPAHYLYDEVGRYRAALDTVKIQLQATRRKIPRNAPVDIVALIDVHLMMVEDSVFSEGPVHHIEQQRCNAEWALHLQRQSLVKSFEEMSDPYLRSRMDDVEQVANRILGALLRDASHPADYDGLQGSIVLADDLSPADTLLLQHHGVRAVVTAAGGVTSHTAILARGLGVPTVVGAHHALCYIRHDDLLVVDGDRGVLIVEPDARALRHYRARQREVRREWTALRALKSAPAVSRDGVAVTLEANIELPEDMAAVRKVGAVGVGLYRTEFLFLNRDGLPDEEEQYAAYLRVVRAQPGAPVTIRTLDLGADKHLDGATVGDGRNPALGLRAVRLCLSDPALFRPQLRAILRASAHGSVRLCIPMVSSVREVRQVRALVQDCQRELSAQGLRHDPALPIGAMIEVPAAALIAGSLARHLDFFSIGTNDLIQYTLAADRLDDTVDYVYDPLHPAVLRLIGAVMRAAGRASVPVCMCGEMAGDARYTRLLLGMGLRNLSMHPARVLEVKRAVQNADVNALRTWVRRIMRAMEAEQVSELVDSLNATS